MVTPPNRAAPTPPSTAEQEPPMPRSISVKPESQEITISNNQFLQIPKNQLTNRRNPNFTESVAQLRDLSTALSAFQRRYDELQEHLSFIQNAIDSKLPHHLTAALDPSASQSEPIAVPESAVVEQNVSNKQPEPTLASESAVLPQSEPTPVSKSAALEQNLSKKQSEAVAVSESVVLEQSKSNNSSFTSAIQSLCEKMSSKELRRYITSNLSDIDKLRKEVPEALKCAPNPGKLVLDCMGRFFLQGSKAYEKNSHMIPAREASILILELFLLMGCGDVEIDAAAKKEAEVMALQWRKRLVVEGGLSRACEIDARGLLLLVGCFGIPDAFKSDDISDLIYAGNAREISGLLRRSSVLLERIPGIIERMVKYKMEVEAINIIYIFGVQDKFPPQEIITSFLLQSKDAWKRNRQAASGQFSGVNKANRKRLAELKSLKRCLENHKIDPQKLLPVWTINETISTLEKDIADFDKKMEKGASKRKSDVTESPKKHKTQEAKRPRVAGDGGLPRHMDVYTSTSLRHEYGAGAVPDNFPGSTRVGSVSALRARAGDGMPEGSRLDVPLAGSVDYGGILIDRVGLVRNDNGYPYGWHGDGAFRERVVGHSHAGQPASTGIDGSYRPPMSFEGFPGLPNPGPDSLLNRSSVSDLYQFADAVVERELYHGSGSRTAVPIPHGLPTHHPSYYY